MNVTITSKVIDDHLYINASGLAANIEDLKLLMRQYYEEILKYGMNSVMIDKRDVQFPMSLEPAVALADYCSEAFPDEIKFWKIAAVVSSNIMGIASFWEFQANQKGYGYKVFSSVEEAREFLNGKKTVQPSH